MYTSELLEREEVYSRKKLIETFKIYDATINTGLFHPKNWDSIWLFITEKKTSDRTQYQDILEEDTLFWEGQLSGKTDAIIVNHEAN